MKILHVYKTYLPETIGGIQQVINQIIRGAVDLGVYSEVLSLSSTKGNKTIGINGHLVHQCYSNFEIASTPFSISAFSKFRQLAHKADLIHYHFPYPFADILHAILGLNKPSLLSYHSDIVKQKYLLRLYKPLMNNFLAKVDHIVVASPNYLKTSETLSLYKDKTSVIQYGLDKCNYPMVSANRLSFWKNKFNNRFFLFVGVFRYYKGLHILLEAAKSFSYPIVIVGSGSLETDLKKQAEINHLRNVHFVGALPDEDKVALLILCYAFVLPSHLRSEAFGISLLEAAMYGKALVSSEIGTGTTFINIDKETGIVVPPNDSEALGQAMNYLWNNPAETIKMGKKAEARYQKLFTAEQMAKSYVELYEKILDRDAKNH